MQNGWDRYLQFGPIPENPEPEKSYASHMASTRRKRSLASGQMVPATEIVRHFSVWQDRSNEQPITILHHGRPRSILLSLERYGELLAAQGSQDEREARLRAQLDIVLATIPGLFIQFDQDQNVIRINGAAAAFFQRNPADIAGLALHELFPGEAGRRITSSAKKMLGSGMAGSMTIALTAGSHHQAEIVPFPGGGAFFATNITSTTETEELNARRHAQEQLLLMMRGCAVGEIDIEGKLVQIHSSLTRLLRLRAVDLAGAAFCGLFDENSRRRCELHVSHVLAGKGPVCCRADIVTRDRGVVSIRLFLAPKLIHGKIDSILFSMLDDSMGALPMR